MQLLDNGLGVQLRDWIVNQTQAAGYSRVYYILSGDATYSDGHITRPLPPGRMYVFPAQSPYRITHNPEHPIECLWFHMDLFPCAIDRLLEFDPSQPEHRTLAALLDALCSEGKFFKNNDSLYLTLAEALSLLILRHPQAKQPDAVLGEILNAIRAQMFSPSLTVLELSRQFGYSTSHFIRLFKEGMNTTPHRYIAVLRLSAAAKRLAEGAPVSETATACGYTDVKTFARAFKKAFGVPPSAYVRFYRPEA